MGTVTTLVDARTRESPPQTAYPDMVSPHWQRGLRRKGSLLRALENRELSASFAVQAKLWDSHLAKKIRLCGDENDDWLQEVFSERKSSRLSR